MFSAVLPLLNSMPKETEQRSCLLERHAGINAFAYACRSGFEAPSVVSLKYVAPFLPPLPGLCPLWRGTGGLRPRLISGSPSGTHDSGEALRDA